MRTATILCMTALLLGGCVSVVPAYEPVGSHTLKVSADQEADVVWVQRLDADLSKVRLFRCHNAPTGPTCIEAKTQ